MEVLYTVKKKNIITHIYSSLLILCPSLLFTFTGDAPQLIILVSSILFISLLLPYTFKETARTYIYSATSIFVIITFMTLLFPVDTYRFFLLPIDIICPSILITASITTFYKQKKETLTLIIALSTASMIFAASTVSTQINVNFTLLNFVWMDVNKYYTILSSIFITITLVLLARKNTSYKYYRSKYSEKKILKFSIIIASIIFILFSSYLMIQSIYMYQRFAENKVSNFFAKYISSRLDIANFKSEFSLKTKNNLFSKNDNQIILRAISTSAPGYLRAKVYSKYENEKWYTINKKQIIRKSRSKKYLTYYVYDIKNSKSKPKSESITIFPKSNISKKNLFITGDTRKITIVAKNLKMMQDGFFSIEDFDFDAAYTITTEKKHISDSAFSSPSLSKNNIKQYLQIPIKIKNKIISRSNKIFSNLVNDDKIKLELINYFSKNFKYKYPPSLSNNKEPILEFLKKKEGHCELFASAGIMLLRSKGIPSRYVAGLVCTENIYNKMWLARKSDLHAWIEIYSKKTQQWELFEPSPPSARPRQNKIKNKPFLKVKEWITFNLKGILAYLKQGYVLRNVMIFFIALWEIILKIFSNIIYTLLFISIISSLIYIIVLYKMKHKKIILSQKDYKFKILHKLLNKMEILAKKHNFERKTTQTLREFANNANINDKKFVENMNLFVNIYEELRYSNKATSKESVKRIENSLKQMELSSSK